MYILLVAFFFSIVIRYIVGFSRDVTLPLILRIIVHDQLDRRGGYTRMVEIRCGQPSERTSENAAWSCIGIETPETTCH
ncbi:hypothetical protein EDB82DRAFT_509706 [Fusarium venenatum]|uniref:uncharacterized protein n=1 Tax=Fusarium venenatum TaxID=56646 RepID=UPI001D6571B1|nr:hypothetical protein EDB82DRAFT_509706 [Fusarium venenatum]